MRALSFRLMSSNYSTQLTKRVQIELIANFAGVKVNRVPRVSDIEHEV